MRNCEPKSSQPTTVTFKKAVQVEEKLLVKLQLGQSKTKSQPFTKKNIIHEEFDRIMRDVVEIFEQMEHAEVRRLITEDKVRPDGRKVDKIRPLMRLLTLFPAVHGLSGLFTRGQTQALST